jgi:PAS domain S-box-containing protein
LTNSLNVLALASQDLAATWLEALRQVGFDPQITRYSSIQTLSRVTQALSWQVALCSDTLGDFNPAAVIPAIHLINPSLPVIIIARQPSIEAAVAAIKAGASQYLGQDHLANLGAVVQAALAETAHLAAAETLRKRDELRYRQMFENNSAIKLLIDPATGAIVDGNEAACRFYGYTHQALTALNIEAINTLSPGEIKTEMERAESEQRLYFEFKHRLASGAIRDVEVRSSPLQLEGQRLLYSVVHDITGRKQAVDAELTARQELERLATLLAHQAGELDAIIEAMPDGVFVCDAKGKLTRINPRGRQIFGLDSRKSPVEQVGGVILYYPTGQPVEVANQPLLQALRGIIQTDFRGMLHHQVTGAPVQVRISFGPNRNSAGSIRGAVAIISDVTELQQLEHQKDEFLTIASHELKTPITSIKGLTQLAIRRLIQTGQTREVESLRKVEKQVDRLIELINDMLDTRRIQHGKLDLDFRPFDFAALARESCLALQATTRQHTITIETPPELIVTGDSHRLAQVLNHLLTNAIKYSPQGGPVEVKLEQRGTSAYLSVQDHGIGVPPQDRPNLFQPFHRASNVSIFQVAGFGLGLYLCSEIMKAHQGRLWLEDRPGLAEPSAQAEWDEQAANSGAAINERGSLFCLSLPLGNPQD